MEQINARLVGWASTSIKTIAVIYYSSLFSRSAAQLVFLIVTSKQKANPRILRSSSSDGYSSTNDEMASGWLYFLGTYYLNDLGIYTYSAYCIGLLGFFFYPLIYRDQVNQYINRSCSVVFFARSSESYQRTEDRIDQVILESIASNLTWYHNAQREALRKHYFTGEHPTGDRCLEYLAELHDSTMKQHWHLVRLMSNRSPLWPPHRNELWRQKLRTDGVLIYIATFSAMWVVIETIAIATTYNSIETIKLSKIPFDSFKVRLAVAENLVILWRSFDWLAGPIPVLLAIMRDQLQLLAWMDTKLNKLLLKIDCLLIDPGATLYSDRSKPRLDGEVLEAHLCYQIFNYELQSSLKLWLFILCPNIAFIIVPNTCFLWSLKNYEKTHVSEITVIAILVLAAGNVIALAHAFVNEKCLKLTKKCFSILGRTADDARLVMSPHTRLLWCRINGDPISIKNRYCCKLAGIYGCNYEGVIAFNAWLISLVMLFLKH